MDLELPTYRLRSALGSNLSPLAIASFVGILVLGACDSASDQSKDPPASKTTDNAESDEESGTPSDEEGEDDTASEKSKDDDDDSADASKGKKSGDTPDDSSSSGSQEKGEKGDKDDKNEDNGDDKNSEVPTKLPKVSGTCPEFKTGEVEFNPKGLKITRSVRMWISDQAKNLDGPLIYYWHGTGSSPMEAQTGLGAVILEVNKLGGIVVAPIHDPEAGTFPWFLTGDPTGKRLDDLILADEILACAIEKVGVDLKHIHSLGLSAGALQTSQMSYRRSDYIASVAAYSGGFILDGVPLQNPNNKISAMIMHGGKDDIVVVKFKETSERYLDSLNKNGHFGFICDHGNGHRIPRDAVPSVWKFFQDHPYNIKPKPYAGALPSSFPGYCKLP